MDQHRDEKEDLKKLTSEEETKQKPEQKDPYEKYCYMCRRSESQAGKLIHMPGDVYICQDCMQKTFDSMNNGSLRFLDIGAIDPSKFDF